MSQDIEKVEIQSVQVEVMPEIDGAFVQSLKRNNKQVKQDRAQGIAEDTQMVYKRRIEDLELSIKRMRRKQTDMIDLSSDNALSTKPAQDFDPVLYVTEDVQLATQIRESEILLGIAKERYGFLFGDS